MPSVTQENGGEGQMREEPAGVDCCCYVSVPVSQCAADQHSPLLRDTAPSDNGFAPNSHSLSRIEFEVDKISRFAKREVKQISC